MLKQIKFADNLVKKVCYHTNPCYYFFNLVFNDLINIQVDMTKVKLDTIKPWIANRITELLGGMEDDVVVEYVFNQLDADKVIINISIYSNCHSLI